MDLHFKKHNKYFFWNQNQLIKGHVNLNGNDYY